MERDDPSEHPRVDGFSDLSEIGCGGFSVVYSATQESFNRRVALKVFNVTGTQARRLEREAEAMGRLSGLPFVVQAHQVTSTTDGRPALVMALMPTSLAESVGGGPLGADITGRWVTQVAEALEAAHALGVYHRDIKPENILISTSGDAHLADFGIAEFGSSSPGTETITSLSPPYAPPERFTNRNEHLSAGDMYSLAATFYAALCGHPPFGTTDKGGMLGLMTRIANDPLPKVFQLTDEAYQVLATAMAKDPAQRPARPTEFARLLTSALASGMKASTTRATFGEPSVDRDQPMDDVQASLSLTAMRAHRPDLPHAPPTPTRRKPAARLDSMSAASRTDFDKGFPRDPNAQTAEPPSKDAVTVRRRSVQSLDDCPSGMDSSSRRQGSIHGHRLALLLFVVVVALAAAGIGSAAWITRADDDAVSTHEPAAATTITHTTSIGSEQTTTPASTATTAAVGEPASRAAANSVAATVEVGNGPTGVALADGSVWITNQTDGTVSRIDSGTNIVTATIRVGSDPSRVITGAGAVWVTNSASRTVSRIDPTTNAVVATVNVAEKPVGIAMGESAVWVANQDSDSVSRIDPVTNTVTATIPVGMQVAEVATGHGAVWVASGWNGVVYRIDPTTNAVTTTIDVGGDPAGVSTTGDAVWVSDALAPAVFRIAPATNTVDRSVPLSAPSFGIATGNGAVWAVQGFGGNTVTRIDPATDTATATIDVGGSPTGVAASDDAVWVTNYSSNTVSRITP